MRKSQAKKVAAREANSSTGSHSSSSSSGTNQNEFVVAHDSEDDDIYEYMRLTLQSADMRSSINKSNKNSLKATRMNDQNNKRPNATEVTLILLLFTTYHPTSMT